MSNESTPSIWRTPDGAIYNGGAVAYAFVGHAVGLALLIHGGALGFVSGTLITAHTLVVAGYLIHECAHLAVFRRRDANARLGEALGWLTGAAYASFDRIQHMHLRHHGDRADVTCFDLHAFLERAPGWLRRVVLALEWAYVPASELIMHAQVMVRPFTDRSNDDALRGERRRVVLMAASRLLFFAGLAALNPWALAGYGVAYMIFLQVLYLGDAFAHTYPFYSVERDRDPVPREGRDAAYDTTHTWSNLVSTRWRALNKLNLNFGFHNAHHDRPAEPWYRLPEVHDALYAADSPQVLPYREILRSFHTNRVRCVAHHEESEVGTGPGRADDFLGVHGVSFLSIV